MKREDAVANKRKDKSSDRQKDLLIISIILNINED